MQTGMEVTIKLSDLIKEHKEDNCLPYRVWDETYNHIWLYDKKIDDYWNEDDDKQLFRDCSNEDRELKIWEFYCHYDSDNNSILELYCMLGEIYKEILEIKNKLN